MKPRILLASKINTQYYIDAVNSHHHQALKNVAEGFDVTVMSDDGVIEAIEHKSLPVFGVQWHPERMCFDAKREDTVDGSKVIEAFIKMCRER